MRWFRTLSLCFATLAIPAAHASSAQALLMAQNEGVTNTRYLLTGPDGGAVSDENFRGRYQLVTFGYTFCPDICPTTLVEIAEILKQLGSHAARIQPVFISLDPERDTPQVLKTYTAFFDPRILGLTGSPASIKRVAQNYKVRFAKTPGSSGNPDHYVVDHSAGLFLIGPDGLFIRKIAYGRPLEAIIADIKQVMRLP